MKLSELNKATRTEAESFFGNCCTASRWTAAVTAGRPYDNLQTLKSFADCAWQKMGYEDYMEAFAGHPKIGDITSLKEKYHSTLSTASSEQSGINSASLETLQELKDMNSAYEEKFGFIFIVFASGKSADEMLDIIKSRMQNEAEVELRIAAAEQGKITVNRLNLIC